jgi:twitching motility protein PilT
MNYSLPQLLKTLIEQKGSDLHIAPDSPPRIRVDGALLPLDVPPLTPDQTMQLCYSILSEEQRKQFESEYDIDLAFAVKNLARFRANVYVQKGAVAAVFRVIPLRIYTMQELNLPPILSKLCEMPRGLVLVTGPTGSGKSTTLASMINHINESRQESIVTIEDPIEFVHPHKNCLVNQREVGPDTKSFSRALKSVLRQDPDVVLVGELRDVETIAMAVTTAETGHLVFATLHTNSCVSTLNRIIDVFPAEQQLQIRTQLSLNLAATVSQLLIPAQGGGRVCAMEIMIPNPAIRNLIREDKFHQIYSAMQVGQDQTGMRTMNQDLSSLIRKNLIARKSAFELSPEPEELEMLLQNKTATNARR